MKKLIILLLCCGGIIDVVGCGGDTAQPHPESPQITVSETAITETPPVTLVTPTEKETVSIESQKQASESTPTTPTTTVKSTEEIKSSKATNISAENDTSQTVEITSQHTESETTVTESTKEITQASETPQPEFDIYYWITFAKEYAVSVGLILDSNAVSCWDNPIAAGIHFIYLERDIKSRLNRYAKDEDITDIWIWAEPIGNDCYDIYIGYA